MAAAKSSSPIRFSVLRQRREELSRLEGQRLTQEDIAARTGDALSQRTVSHLEAGSIELGSIAATRLAALARALKWSLSDLQQATGMDLAIYPATPEDNNAVAIGPVKAAAPAKRTSTRNTNGDSWTLEELLEGDVLLPNLAEAVRQYGSKKMYQEFATPKWIVYLNNFDFYDGEDPEPEAWLQMWQTLRNAGVKPGEE